MPIQKRRVDSTPVTIQSILTPANYLWDLQNSRSCPGQSHWSHLRPWVQWISFLSFRATGSLMAEIKHGQYLTLKVRGQGHCHGQNRWSHFRRNVESIFLLFVPWQWDAFGLRCKHISLYLTWKIQYMRVMDKVKANGHIWGPRFQSMCFLNNSWQSDYFWDIPKSIFDLDNSRLRSQWESQGHGQGQSNWSYLRPRAQLICLLFVYFQSGHLRLRNSKGHIWPWQLKTKVMAKVKPDCDVWDLEFTRSVCVSLRGNRTICGRNIENSIFYLANSRSESHLNSNKTYQIIYRAEPPILPNMNEIGKVVWEL